MGHQQQFSLQTFKTGLVWSNLLCLDSWQFFETKNMNKWTLFGIFVTLLFLQNITGSQQLPRSAPHRWGSIGSSWSTGSPCWSPRRSCRRLSQLDEFGGLSLGNQNVGNLENNNVNRQPPWFGLYSDVTNRQVVAAEIFRSLFGTHSVDPRSQDNKHFTYTKQWIHHLLSFMLAFAFHGDVSAQLWQS